MPFGTNLTATPGLDNVPGWDTATPLAGGPATAALNVQAQALLNRIAYLLTAGGANQIGIDTLGAYDPNTVGAAVLQALAAIVPLGGVAGQIVLNPDGAGGYTIGFTSPATFPGVVNIPGRTDASEPAAGKVGEYKEWKVASGSAVVLSTGTVANVIAFTLQPGDWDVNAFLCFNGDATSVTLLAGGIASASATAPAEEFLGSVRDAGTAPLGVDQRFGVPMRRVNVSVATNFWLIAQAGFSGGTVCKAYGKVWARRRS